MSYLQLSLPVSAADFQEISTLLEQQGALAITATDAENNPILEPPLGEIPLWQRAIITALFNSDKNKTAIESALSLLLNSQFLSELKWATLAEQNWERAWLTHYQPVEFENRLWVGPQSFTPPATTAASLFLDPGLAFGTGSHPTTYLCLQWLAYASLQGKTLLDFGCGSGILALAALKLGALHATGIDIDPQALQASMENAKRNEISTSSCSFYLAREKKASAVDIVIANILANPLIELAPLLCSYLKPDGILVLSGILKNQATQVQQAYSGKIIWQEIQVRDDWTRLVGKMQKD